MQTFPVISNKLDSVIKRIHIGLFHLLLHFQLLVLTQWVAAVFLVRPCPEVLGYFVGLFRELLDVFERLKVD